ncbi:3-hydroxyacyl-CoA dehydrogenase [Rhodovulum sp. DZ06]|uniref:3-hydroxyacyl-CoA dehydrogenase n=1 Tax=Rhodovulum sp. DZ06 TaxID=3425126 RepID=UPI003D3435D0
MTAPEPTPKTTPENTPGSAPRRVALVGAGLIGRAWAIAFARGGWNVALWDPAEGAAQGAIDLLPPLLSGLAEEGLLRGQDPAAVAARVRPAATLEEALAEACHVQENAPERLEVKLDLWARMDAAAPAGATLASSTSAIPASRFTEGLAGRARCMVAHPINPPYLVPAVEIVPAPWTDPEAAARVAAVMEGIGQSPILMQREIEGFVMNRLQGALLEEAFRLVADGVASPEDVDRGIRDGLGLRWAFMGPFETIDLNAPGGVEDYAARFDGMYRDIHASAAHRADWAETVRARVAPDRAAALPRAELGARQAWRDRRLMALLRHKQGQPEA